MRVLKSTLEKWNKELTEENRQLRKEITFLKEQIAFFKQYSPFQALTPFIIATEKVTDALAHVITDFKELGRRRR